MQVRSVIQAKTAIIIIKERRHRVSKKCYGCGQTGLSFWMRCPAIGKNLHTSGEVGQANLELIRSYKKRGRWSEIYVGRRGWKDENAFTVKWVSQSGKVGVILDVCVVMISNSILLHSSLIVDCFDTNAFINVSNKVSPGRRVSACYSAST